MIHYVKLVHFIFWTFLLSCSGNELLSCDVVLGNLQRINMVVAFYFYFLGGKTPDPASLKNVRTYKDIMEEQDLHRDQVHYDLKTSNSSHYICPRVGYDVFYAMNCTILISKYVYFFFACRLLN